MNKPQARVFSLEEIDIENKTPYRKYVEQAKSLPSGQGIEIDYGTRYSALLAVRRFRTLIAAEPMKLSQKSSKVKIWKI